MRASWCPRRVFIDYKNIQARIWVALRLYVDHSGCGHIPWEEAVQGVAYTLDIGPKYAAKLLRKEAGRLWNITVSPRGCFVHLAGTKSLGLDDDMMVQCPAEALRSPRAFRSYIYCLSLRAEGGPLTRWDVARCTGVKRTTQWIYEGVLAKMGHHIIACSAVLYMDEHDHFKMTPISYHPLTRRVHCRSRG